MKSRILIEQSLNECWNFDPSTKTYSAEASELSYAGNGVMKDPEGNPISKHEAKPGYDDENEITHWTVTRPNCKLVIFND